MSLYSLRPRGPDPSPSSAYSVPPSQSTVENAMPVLAHSFFLPNLMQIYDSPALLEVTFNLFPHSRLQKLAGNEFIDCLSDERNEWRFAECGCRYQSFKMIYLARLQPELFPRRRNSTCAPHAQALGDWETGMSRN